MQGLLVSEDLINYKLVGKSSEQILLEVYKACSDEGIIIINNSNEILYISESARKLLGPLLSRNKNDVISLPYSILKPKSIVLKVNSNKFRTIEITAKKTEINRKKYYMLKLKSVNSDNTLSEPHSLNGNFNRKDLIAFKYDLIDGQFIYKNELFDSIFLPKSDDIDVNKKRLFDLMPVKFTEQLYAHLEIIQSENALSKNYQFNIFLKIRNKLESSWIYELIDIHAVNGKALTLECIGIILNDAINEYHNVSEDRLKLKHIGNKLFAGMYCIDYINKEMKMSDNAFKFFGYNKNDLLPLFEHYKNTIHPDDLPAVNLEMLNFMEGKTKFLRMIYRTRTKKGEWKWVENRASIYKFDETGNPAKIVGIFIDMYEQKRMEEELLHYKTLFDNIMKYIPDVIFITDAKGKLKYISDYNEKITGIKNEDFLNKYIYDTQRMVMSENDLNNISYDDLKSSTLEFLSNTINHGSQGAFTTHHSHKNGTQFLLESIMYPIFKNEIDEPLVMSISRNITGISMIKDELSDRGIIYDELFDLVENPILIFDSVDGTILRANHESELIYGFSKKKLTTMTIFELSANSKFGKKMIKETIQSNKTINFTSHQKDSFGRKFEINITGAYITFMGKNVIISIGKFINYLK